jgi:DNA-directed RNA polymerase subunit RPC12/RpoP
MRRVDIAAPRGCRPCDSCMGMHPLEAPSVPVGAVVTTRFPHPSLCTCRHVACGAVRSFSHLRDGFRALRLPVEQPKSAWGQFRGGTIVALQVCMFETLSATATMSCPKCGRPVEPAADSTWVVSWYTCLRCGHEWSARIRNGRPDLSSVSEVFVQTPARKERP